VLRSVDYGQDQNTGDMATLLYWVSYHDILSRFSLRYWKHSRPLIKQTIETDPEDVDILVKETTSLEVCPLVSIR
jgi:hypothetical protein